jgi:Xaa-Pro aminopeptidase
MDRIFKKADIVFLSGDINTFYFSRYRGEGVFVATATDAKYFTDPRYSEEAKEQAACAVVESKKPFADAAALIKEHGGTVGCDFSEMTHSAFLRLAAELDSLKLVDISAEIKEIRSVKSDAETELIKAAAAINDKAYAELLSRVREGMTEMDMAAELEYLMKLNGAEALAFETIAAFGENGSRPHAHPSQRKLRRGDMVTLDFGAKRSGYCSDITRTFSFGNPSEKMKSVYETVLSANLVGLSAALAGVKACDVDTAARSYIAEKGMGEYFTHSTGHGVGAEIHELPWVNPTNETILIRNMVITVEPGIYIPDLGGVRIEDLVVIKEDGLPAEILSKTPKKLIIM